MAQVVVTHSEADTMLLEMSVIGKNMIKFKSSEEHTQTIRQLGSTRI
jgi:hypothetical protein